jgi:hypothetical protein
VRKLAISFFLLFLTGAFVQMPALAAPGGSPSAAATMGIVLQANHAQVSADLAASGATVFDGDSLLTDSLGTLQVRFGGSQAYLLPNSAATVHQSAAGFGATLTGGTVIVSSSGGQAFFLLADGATIRPGSSQPTTAQITMVSPHELNLVSEKGSLEISMDSEVKTIAEGSSFRMVIDPAGAAGSAEPQGAQQWSPTVSYSKGDVVTYNGVMYQSLQGNNLDNVPGEKKGPWKGGKGGPNASGNGSGNASPTGSNRFLLFALGLVGLGVGIGLWQALVSPDKP